MENNFNRSSPLQKQTKNANSGQLYSYTNDDEFALETYYNNHSPFYGYGTRFLINCLHPIQGRQKINGQITHGINFLILSVPPFQSLPPQHLLFSLLFSALLSFSSVSPAIVTNFECGQRKEHTIEFSVGNLISFVVSGINITRAQPRPRIWPSALQLRLLLVFC